MENSKANINSVAESAKEYLNKKYNDDEFSQKLYSGKKILNSYYSVIFNSKKYNDVFEVRMYDDGTVKDNYFHLYMKDDAEKYFESIGDKINAKTFIKFPKQIWSNEIKDASSFLDYLNSNICHIDAYFVTNTELENNLKEELLKDIAKAKIQGEFIFYSLKENVNIDGKTIDDLINNYSTYIALKTAYTIDSNFNVVIE